MRGIVGLLTGIVSPFAIGRQRHRLASLLALPLGFGFRLPNALDGLGQFLVRPSLLFCNFACHITWRAPVGMQRDG